MSEFPGTIQRYLETAPVLHPTAFVASGAIVIGDVSVGEQASLWFHAVLRGDINRIRIGARSNIQDGAVVHVADDLPAMIGDDVTCGHRAILHACSIGNQVLIGMGATILDGAIIGERCIIGANALVTQHKNIPAGSLVLGAPARVVRELTEAEQASIKRSAERYVELAQTYRRQAERIVGE